MKRALTRIFTAVRTLRALGPAQPFWYAVYQAGLRSGAYQRSTPAAPYPAYHGSLRSPYRLPDRDALIRALGEQLPLLLEEADEIVDGKARLFGSAPVPFNLTPPESDRHWTYYEHRPETWGVEDIKLIWEPARFGWIYPLGRAYHITGSERYALAFWRRCEEFSQANLPNRGPNWASGQEVALRMMALLFAARVFAASPESTPERMAHLGGMVAAHARRIPPTLSYARAQNNNHHITEALGLYAAGCALTDHPAAKKWQSLGWRELNRALQKQIEPDGTYAQHSMNYHRLMLHAALQGLLMGAAYRTKTHQRLVAAVLWLHAQVDPISGRVPNLGSNDGANILPLAQADFGDFRPTAQAAARAFLGAALIPPGPWDELGLWLGQQIDPANGGKWPASPAVHILRADPAQQSWASLRAARFHGRPSHADQLHVDLWWRGENIALDAGTFRYTAPPPWDNSLASTFVHNTVEINALDQMQRAGRFLWLNWAQAELLPSGENEICAQHDGYRRVGVLHRRTLRYLHPDGWQVIDQLLPSRAANSTVFTARLNWLLPDWPWSLNGCTLTLDHPGGGSVHISIMPDLPHPEALTTFQVSLARAGQRLDGDAPSAPNLGWFAPTYNRKIPALSFSLLARAPLPLTLISDWTLAP